MNIATTCRKRIHLIEILELQELGVSLENNLDEEKNNRSGLADKKNTLSELLKDTNSLPLITVKHRESIERYVNSGELMESTAVTAWRKALSEIKECRSCVSELRRNVAQVIIEENVLPAFRSGVSYRVVGTLLKGALEWDKHAIFPEELRSINEKMAPPKRCDRCGISGVNNCCPCEAVSYCSRECQVADWKKHKRTCLLRHRQKSERLAHSAASS
jgi:MYND finger